MYLTVYLRGMASEDVAELRSRLNAVAAEFGYTAERGPTAGEGNLASMLEAIDAGEVALVLLPPEQQAQAAWWLRKQAAELPAPDFAALALKETLETIAAALEAAMERAREAE